jgi:hypothetical protein
MTVLLNATFATGLDGFDAGTQIAAEGQNFETGYLSVPVATTATRSFTAISSGVFRVDWYVKVDDSSTSSGNNTKNQEIFLLPTAGAISAANSITTITLSRSTADGANSLRYNLRRQTGAGEATFAAESTWRRGDYWFKMSVVGNFSGTTFDTYLNDVLWETGLSWGNAAAADFSRIVIQCESAAPTLLVDSVRVESNWVLPTETLLVSDDFTTQAGLEIEDTTPAINTRSIHPQPWKIADVSTTGAFTRDATGLIPDTAKNPCLALIQCGPEGIFETDWTTATSGVIYIGLLCRGWEGQADGGDGYIILRYRSDASAGEQLRVFQGAQALVSSDGTAGGITWSLNTPYTLKAVIRGRFGWFYVNDQLQFGGPVELGDRGLLSEEHAGPLIITFFGSVTNRCTAFRYTGRAALPGAETVAFGSLTFRLEPGGIREFYHAGHPLPERNLFWSKGIQCSHVSAADLGNYDIEQETLIDATNVKCFRQRSVCLSEDDLSAAGELFFTLLRRGPWIDDRLLYLTNESGRNFTPDQDFRTELWSLSHLVADATGPSSQVTITQPQDFTVELETVGLPKAIQAITTTPGDKVRMTMVVLPVENVAALTSSCTSKSLGNGDPTSLAFNINGASLTVGQTYEVSRAYLIEAGSGLTLDDDTITSFRDDFATPATLTFSAGTLNTSQDGDFNNDGFNERFGWHEVNCAASGGANVTMLLGSVAMRHSPAIRLHNYTLGSNPDVRLLGNEDPDYVFDDLGDGTAILQLLVNMTGDTDIIVEAQEPILPPGITGSQFFSKLVEYLND